MSQFAALLYKNSRLIRRQWVTTLFQLLSPLFCILCVYVLEDLARLQAEKDPLKPPIEIPFGGLYPINLPTDLFDLRDFGYQSCLKMNKYGFEQQAGPDSVHFVEQVLGFKRQTGLRTSVCKCDNLQLSSPFFNRSAVSSAREVQQEVLDEIKRFAGTRISDVWKSLIPTDGFYLFEQASQSRVAATLFSNNFNLMFYHRANGQTMLSFRGFPVSSQGAPGHRGLPAPGGLREQQPAVQGERRQEAGLHLHGALQGTELQVHPAAPHVRWPNQSWSACCSTPCP